uniref:Uncharacterized protein n=1 Tax=Trichuris muris TaxID=70415 RepID=A0A5S6QBF0_TRIMR
MWNGNTGEQVFDVVADKYIIWSESCAFQSTVGTRTSHVTNCRDFCNDLKEKATNRQGSLSCPFQLRHSVRWATLVTYVNY